MAQTQRAIGEWVDLLFAGLKPPEARLPVAQGAKPGLAQPKAAK